MWVGEHDYGYLAIERPDSPVLLVEPKVSLGRVLVLVRAAKTAAQPERVVVGPPARFSNSVSTVSLMIAVSDATVTLLKLAIAP